MLQKLITGFDLTDSQIASKVKEGILFIAVYIVVYAITMLYPVIEYYRYGRNVDHVTSDKIIAVTLVIATVIQFLGIMLATHPVIGMLTKKVRATILFTLGLLTMLGIWYVTLLDISKPLLKL